MEGLFQLIPMTIFGIVCALIAGSRGRSGVAWFIIGFFFHCFAIIILLVLPDLKVQEERERRLMKDNQRLRERLRMDRNVADHRYSDTLRRLDAHDQALGLDTSPALENPDYPDALSAPSGEHESAAKEYPPYDYETLAWYYVEAGAQVGPVDFPTLARLWKQGGINNVTLVWQENMDDWKAVGELPGLEELLGA